MVQKFLYFLQEGQKTFVGSVLFLHTIINVNVSSPQHSGCDFAAIKTHKDVQTKPFWNSCQRALSCVRCNVV